MNFSVNDFLIAQQPYGGFSVPVFGAWAFAGKYGDLVPVHTASADGWIEVSLSGELGELPPDAPFRLGWRGWARCYHFELYRP